MKPSVLGNIASFTIGNVITIPITKYNSSYADTINIYVGSTWIKRIEQFTSGQATGTAVNKSVSFTEAEINNIYRAMPNVTAASFRFVNTTYNGANIVGTSEKQATGSINVNIKPTISDVSLTEAISAITTKFGGYVQYQSRIIEETTATPGYGSTIDFYSGIVGTYYIMDNPITTNVLTISGTNNYSVTVTDKRGRSATSSGTFEVLEYDSPQITNFSVIRCNAEGTEDLYGNYIKVNAGGVISDVNNLNDKMFKVQYKLTSATEWTDLITYNSSYIHSVTDSVHSGFSEDNTYDFRYIVTDFFTTAKLDVSLSAGFAIIDLKANGKGVGLGTLSTKNALQIGYDIYDKFDTKINNGLALYEAGGQTDVDTTIEELVLSALNTPTTGFWYVKTMFYGTKSETTNRTQMAYPYSDPTATPCMRMYYNGGWSEWRSVASIIGAKDYEGNFLIGKTVIETGWVTITPAGNNVPTSVVVNFSNTYKYIPVVMTNAATGATGSQVLGTSTNGISKTGATVVLNRTNTIATIVYYWVIGEVN